MRYWKTSILWICLTPWHLAYFGGGGWKCEHAWGSVASNNSIKELPSPFPEQFSVHISCPLRKGSSKGHRCSALRKGLWQEGWDVELPGSFTCQWWGISCCQQVCTTLLFVSWKASAQACAFFTAIFEGFSCSRDKYGTPEGGKDFEVLPELC